MLTLFSINKIIKIQRVSNDHYTRYSYYLMLHYNGFISSKILLFIVFIKRLLFFFLRGKRKILFTKPLYKANHDNKKDIEFFELVKNYRHLDVANT